MESVGREKEKKRRGPTDILEVAGPDQDLQKYSPSAAGARSQKISLSLMRETRMVFNIWMTQQTGKLGCRGR